MAERCSTRRGRGGFRSPRSSRSSSRVWFVAVPPPNLPIPDGQTVFDRSPRLDLRPDGPNFLEGDVNPPLPVGVVRRVPPVNRLARNFSRQPFIGLDFDRLRLSRHLPPPLSVLLLDRKAEVIEGEPRPSVLRRSSLTCRETSERGSQGAIAEAPRFNHAPLYLHVQQSNAKNVFFAFSFIAGPLCLLAEKDFFNFFAMCEISRFRRFPAEVPPTCDLSYRLLTILAVLADQGERRHEVAEPQTT